MTPLPESGTSRVWVVTAIPRDKNLGQFVYGVFDSYDFAYEHYERWGDQDCDIQVTAEAYITRK